jgi:hypothetical protein
VRWIQEKNPDFVCSERVPSYQPFFDCLAERYPQ